jgi:NTE family protein
MRALVLCGGGVTGVAWQLGVLAGLFEAGLDLRAADLVIGTSAGSVVGAQIRGRTPLAELYARQLRPADGELSARLGPALMLRYVLANLTRTSEQAGARLGRWALGADTVPEADRIAVIESRLVEHEWPARPLKVTAVDAATGALRVFDGSDGVPLVSAVAASCAVPLVWPPVTIQGRRYLDGGVRSSANADLAVGAGRVVVLAPTPAALRPAARLGAQLATLGRGVSHVLVQPSPAARRELGRNSLDPGRRAPSARAGLAQATEVAAAVRMIWEG